ncbi:hypothetical protein J6590_033692 [Homalodisca vitripennis]|nr:hypothetical protein J6590_033692 [Homalodisca vitripennis]
MGPIGILFSMAKHKKVQTCQGIKRLGWQKTKNKDSTYNLEDTVKVRIVTNQCVSDLACRQLVLLLPTAQ